jgi:hypothetical protein
MPLLALHAWSLCEHRALLPALAGLIRPEERARDPRRPVENRLR